MSVGRVGSPMRTKVHDACKFLSLQTTNASRRVSSELNEILKERTMARKRRKIINEIIETERTYQHHLMLLVDLYLNPLKVSGILPDRVIEGIFCNITALQGVNASLMEHIETDGVAEGFVKLAPFIKLYSVYANNFDQANKLVEEWTKKSPDFARFKELQENNEKMLGLKLNALLITPIQRVPRYKLLLENLVEKTMPEHQDYLKLKGAFEEVSKVATHINECIRQQENFHKMLSIQNSLTGDAAPKILAPGRKFIKEAIFSKVCDRGGSKERTFFLFNDMLIYAKKETSCTYSCRGVFPVVNCLVEQVMGSSVNVEGGSLFKIICKDKTLLLYSRSVQDANSWIKTFKDTISELHSNLASLRRADHSLSPEVETQRMRLRRDKDKKRRPAAQPKFRLLNCTSPLLCKDSLYPLREELLPQPKCETIQESSKEELIATSNSPVKEHSCLPSTRGRPLGKNRKRRHDSQYPLCTNETSSPSYNRGLRNATFGDDTLTETEIRLSLHVEDDYVITGTPNNGYTNEDVFIEHEKLDRDKEEIKAEAVVESTEWIKTASDEKESPDRKRPKKTTHPIDTPSGVFLIDKKKPRQLKAQSKAKSAKHRRKQPTRPWSTAFEDCGRESDLKVLSVRKAENIPLEAEKFSSRKELLDEGDEEYDSLKWPDQSYVPKIRRFSLTDGAGGDSPTAEGTGCQIM